MNVTSRTPVLQPRLPKKRTESECGLVPCRDLFSTYSSRARSFFPQTAARPRSTIRTPTAAFLSSTSVFIFLLAARSRPTFDAACRYSDDRRFPTERSRL